MPLYFALPELPAQLNFGMIEEYQYFYYDSVAYIKLPPVTSCDKSKFNCFNYVEEYLYYLSDDVKVNQIDLSARIQITYL